MTVDLDQRKQTQAFSGPDCDWLTKAKDVAAQAVSAEVVIDFSSVQKISSRELTELIRLQLFVKQSGRRLVIVNSQEIVRQIFILTRLDRLIELRQEGHTGPPKPALSRKKRRN